MSAQLNFDGLMPLSEAARSLPGRPHVSTLHRWRIRGVQGVKLETVRIGGRRFTSLEALERFSASVTAIANGESPPPLSRTPNQRQRAIACAESELDAAGI